MLKSWIKKCMLAAILLSVLLIASPANAVVGEMGECVPKKDDFSGRQIEVKPDRWQMTRSPDTGGANKGFNMLVPDGRVLVGWNYNVTSCNSRCKDPVQILHFKETGVLKIPNGVRVGLRWRSGRLGGPGGLYSGNVSMLHVSLDDWKNVFLDKYFTCE